MPLVSIITAGFAPTADFLNDCWKSISAQQLPPGWELEWVIQEDGAEPELRDRLPSDDRIRYEANGVHLGIPSTRNLALCRARGDLVRNLDQDDVLTPGGLAVLVEALEEYPDCVWAVGDVADLHPDGSHGPFDPSSYTDGAPRLEPAFSSLIEPGRVEAGHLLRVWNESGVFPIHCSGIALRTPVARAFGGWAALPRSEDLSLVTAISTFYPGVYVPVVTFLYRRWEGQTTRRRWWKAMQERAHASVRQRAESAATLLEQSTPSAPSIGQG
jgi:hypothetical protein